MDAGLNGLGLILLQKKEENRWQPVECASRSLTETEKRYSQLEKEALAVRWACERCYMYLIGSTFVVETDQKPLLPLFNNPNSFPPLRIERWLLYLQQFDFKLVYCPGKDNAADYLSRHAIPATSTERKESESRRRTVHAIIQDFLPKSISQTEVQEATKEDPELMQLVTYIQLGKIRECQKDSLTKPFANVFSELSYTEGIVMRGSRIVVPKGLRSRVIEICHEGHMGIVKTKQLLRSKVWFPGIDRHVENLVADCLPCQACLSRATRDPLKMSPLPKGPWVQVSADMCGPFPTGELVLVVLDAYSRYSEVEIVKSTSAEAVVVALERMFAIHGIPEEVKTNNGTPFQSNAFARFSKEKGFIHRKVTPLWPEANGQVENFMKNIGKVAKTAHVSGKNWKKELYTYLSNYRATPHPGTKKSPYELTMNRCVRIKLPVVLPDQSTPEVIMNDQKAKEKMKEYADHTRNTVNHNISTGDIVLVRQRRRNKFSTPFEPIPYIVERVHGTMITAERTTDQRRVTRNSSHYKKFKASSQYAQDQVPWDFEKEDEGSDSPSETEKNSYLPDPEQLNLDDGRSLNHSQPLDQQPTTRKVDVLEENLFGQKTTSYIR